ncbi:hypothetical protein SAMN03159496_05267 [Rhizobium sp. NFR07]|nr:hypothetical protein SAMN03159496_05267 [Rhizobium sp. NFR07]
MPVLALPTAAHKGSTEKFVHFTIPEGASGGLHTRENGSALAVEVQPI